MNEQDKDQVRVDLLKFRRKAYLSYPEGSPERKKFLKTILENELRLTEKEVPQTLIDFLIEGDKTFLWSTIRKFLGWFVASMFCLTVFVLIHTKLSLLILIPGGACLAVGIIYLEKYWAYRKNIETVKKYSNDMKKYMNRISNDIKRLEGPYGY
jgi:hypothetical protein